MAHRPHRVYRKRAEINNIEYWSPNGWTSDNKLALHVEFADALGIIIEHRHDLMQSVYGFGMEPVGGV